MKPLIYTAAQVALLVKFASLLDPLFGVKHRLSRVQVRLMSIGRMKPTAAVMRSFELEKQGREEYKWLPR